MPQKVHVTDNAPPTAYVEMPIDDEKDRVILASHACREGGKNCVRIVIRHNHGAQQFVCHNQYLPTDGNDIKASFGDGIYSNNFQFVFDHWLERVRRTFNLKPDGILRTEVEKFLTQKVEHLRERLEDGSLHNFMLAGTTGELEATKRIAERFGIQIPEELVKVS